jgi:hypothetical protein
VLSSSCADGLLQIAFLAQRRLSQLKGFSIASHVQAQGPLFLPASFSVLEAWGPAIKDRFDTLWAKEFQQAEDSDDQRGPSSAASLIGAAKCRSL